MSSKKRLQSSENSGSPAVINIKRESNNVINSPTKNNQTPIQQLLQEPLQTVMETQESREDQDLSESTPRLTIKQENSQPKEKTRKLKENS